MVVLGRVEVCRDGGADGLNLVLGRLWAWSLIMGRCEGVLTSKKRATPKSYKR